jgi:hypothetical protein
MKGIGIPNDFKNRCLTGSKPVGRTVSGGGVTVTHQKHCMPVAELDDQKTKGTGSLIRFCPTRFNS